MISEKKDLELITVIVQRGQAEKIVKTAIDAGAQAATISFARGTGVREKLGFLGIAIQPEKEVFFVVIEKEKADKVFDAIVKAGKLEQPEQGFAFIQDVRRAYGFIGD
ncbi:MAG TPA: P-II family nitrogen regulator [bacterium]|nr:P-II family nitrogen regulator [bacterium]